MGLDVTYAKGVAIATLLNRYADIPLVWTLV
jgi:hypothetical protein